MAVVRGDRIADHVARGIGRERNHEEDARLNLDEKIGQLFVVDARGGMPLARLEHFVRDLHVGGVIWFQSTTTETVRVNAHLQSIARVPLLISADLEAGMGMRFTDTAWGPPAMAIAATGEPAFAEEQGRATARAALQIGVNHILAPVADVNVDPRNPVINTRSFGEDPHEVARYVAAFVRGVQSEGALATAKHFPGHGDTHIDSHRSLPVLAVTRERLERVELVPFRAAIDADVASVMIGHLAVPALDPALVPVRSAFENVYGTAHDEVTQGGTIPATLSKPIIDILRIELGFDGLVLTDAMDMGGLAAHFDPGEAAIRAIEAGNDQVLFSPDTDAAIAAVREAVHSGRLPEARIDESVARVLRAKQRIGAVSNDPIVDRGTEIAERSIRIVRDTSALLPLRTRNRAVVVVNPHNDPLDRALRAIDAHATPEDADVLVLLLALRPKSGAGTIAVPEAIRELARRHANKIIAISFGSPYALADLGDVSTFVCAWGVQPVMQIAAMRAIGAW